MNASFDHFIFYFVWKRRFVIFQSFRGYKYLIFSWLSNLESKTALSDFLPSLYFYPPVYIPPVDMTLGHCTSPLAWERQKYKKTALSDSRVVVVRWILSTVQGLKVYFSEVSGNNEASFPPRQMGNYLFPFGYYPLILSTAKSVSYPDFL